MSRVVRVYLPATMDDLAALAGSGSFAARAVAHAVTPALRAADPDADTDDWEFQAFSDAAASSLGLLAGGGAPRRVVVSADVDAARVLAQGRARDVVSFGAGQAPNAMALAAPAATDAAIAVEASGSQPASSVVTVIGDVESSSLAAVHIDGVEFEAAVREVLGGAPASTLDDVALEWYSPDEVAGLLG